MNFISTILQMRKMRFRGVKYLAQSLTPYTKQGKDLNFSIQILDLNYYSISSPTSQKPFVPTLRFCLSNKVIKPRSSLSPVVNESIVNRFFQYRM